MRILLVTGVFPARSETFIYRKVRALAARGHDVTVATRKRGEDRLFAEPLPANVTVEVLPPDNTLRDPRRATAFMGGLARQLVRHPREARALLGHARGAWRPFARHLALLGRRVDVVHFEFLSLGAMYGLAHEVLAAPMVVSCRGNDLHTLELRSEAERTAALTCIAHARAVHCVSNEMAAELARISGRREGVWVNRPAVDVSRIAVRAKARTGPLRLMSTGRLIWKKGFDYLLAAYRELVRRDIDFRAEIVGEGELFSALRFSIEDLGLADRVQLVGALTSDEVLARLQRTDVFVLSSVEEGISNAVLEAMATGIPIVTTTAGGMSEAVTDGVEGLVVGVRDARALAAAIARLALDEPLRRTMAHAARARAVAEFSLERQVTVFESMYRSVIS